MSQRQRVLAAIILFFAGEIGTALATTAPGAKCAAKKLRLAAKKYAAFATCDWKVVSSGAPVSADCLAGASAKFATGWQKVEAKGGCATVGDHDAIEQRVDDGRVALESLLGPGPSRCAADRYRAAGRMGRCALTCAARRVQSGNINDDCSAACLIRFYRAFEDASDHGDCGASPGVTDVVTAVDDVVTDIVDALPPSQATTTTTTTSTSTTSTSVPPPCCDPACDPGDNCVVVFMAGSTTCQCIAASACSLGTCVFQPGGVCDVAGCPPGYSCFDHQYCLGLPCTEAPGSCGCPAFETCFLNVP